MQHKKMIQLKDLNLNENALKGFWQGTYVWDNIKERYLHIDNEGGKSEQIYPQFRIHFKQYNVMNHGFKRRFPHSDVFFYIIDGD